MRAYIYTLFSLANVRGSPRSSVSAPDKREDPAYASYTRGSILYIFVQNGFGTIIGDETERGAGGGEGEKSRGDLKQSMRFAQSSRSIQRRFVLCYWISDFRRNLRNSRQFLLVNGALFSNRTLLRHANTVNTRDRGSPVLEAICVSISKFIVGVQRRNILMEESERMLSD